MLHIVFWCLSLISLSPRFPSGRQWVTRTEGAEAVPFPPTAQLHNLTKSPRDGWRRPLKSDEAAFSTEPLGGRGERKKKKQKRPRSHCKYRTEHCQYPRNSHFQTNLYLPRSGRSLKRSKLKLKVTITNKNWLPWIATQTDGFLLTNRNSTV